MGKLTLKGSVPPDDPMFNGGVEFFRKVDTPQEEPRHSPMNFVRRVSINGEGHELQLDLAEDSWSRIQSAQELTCEKLDDNDEFTYRWLFNVEPGYSLVVDFGAPNCMRWMGQLADAEIKGG